MNKDYYKIIKALTLTKHTGSLIIVKNTVAMDHVQVRNPNLWGRHRLVSQLPITGKSLLTKDELHEKLLRDFLSIPYTSVYHVHIPCEPPPCIGEVLLPSKGQRYVAYVPFWPVALRYFLGRFAWWALSEPAGPPLVDLLSSPKAGRRMLWKIILEFFNSPSPVRLLCSIEAFTKGQPTASGTGGLGGLGLTKDPFAVQGILGLAIVLEHAHLLAILLPSHSAPYVLRQEAELGHSSAVHDSSCGEQGSHIGREARS